MYGLYLEAVNDYINESYGEDVWRLIEARAEIPHLKFVRHQMYKYDLFVILPPHAAANYKTLGQVQLFKQQRTHCAVALFQCIENYCNNTILLCAYLMKISLLPEYK